MSSVVIVRRGAQRTRASRAQFEAVRGMKVLGTAESLYRAQAMLRALRPDSLLIDLRLEDGAALTLVRGLRELRHERPDVMLIGANAADPLLFPTLRAGADAYLLEADAHAAPCALRRMAAGEATMDPPIAAQVLKFFNESESAAAVQALALGERTLDWASHAANPMRLSPGECWLLRRLAKGMPCTEIASRMAVSVEAVSRRVGNVYRKLSWDLRCGALTMNAA